ncbi:hypothetical protein AQUCO_01400718v1 [Aquilegia coerulea]|uniref:non-specific serine/threonine protein kinase n=1 Tax=Aquilegia coerulea TaxID=218851 RepID=A0A2G5DXQ6_AQUCA|nr:hypothetical protein AQUCO_01400718v1 [Aquilegia coerulea]
MRDLQIVSICVICIKKKKQQRRANPASSSKMNKGEMGSSSSETHSNRALGFIKSTFTYEELEELTDGFSATNVLGEGGYGYVHKGVLPDGKEVAVKSLKPNCGQGEKEFQAEVEIIGRIHHRHLVSLVGYCTTPGKRILVYKFVPNRTLHYHLHYGRPFGETLNWSNTLAIAIGSAKGLAYLHEDCQPRIIHRDVKATNILLDNNYEAKVADFGLAKLMEDSTTDVSTGVRGTSGYIAPEYQARRKVSEKADVFSYGVVLLELITGRQPIDKERPDDELLVDWARPLLTKAQRDGQYHDLVDRRLDNEYNKIEMARMIACAASCIRKSANRRPQMSHIVRALEGDVSLEILNSTAEHIMRTTPDDV